MDKGTEFSRRTHYQQAARRGSAAAIAALEGPDFPSEFFYLYQWARELFGHSGVGMSGLAPLSYGTIAEWMRLTGTVVYPHEVRALIELDAVMRHPDEEPNA